ncbi:MAG: ABC transporter ATP-binding protein [Candidatus Scalindua sp.]|nr:ABC transporter ATP-binding protein [Candidatus Scalindua sp.]
MSEILRVENVSKQFHVKSSRPSTLMHTFFHYLRGLHNHGRYFSALHDISFSLEHGQTLGIIGHNGAGKSTLLRLLSGIGRPTSGRIIRKGVSGSLLELGTGFHKDLTGRENLKIGGILSGLSKRQVMDKEHEIIAFAELEDFIDQPVRTYSSGMYMRLAFAATIHFEPDILIIDEVLAVGDSNFRRKCIEWLTSFRKKGKTLILTSHDSEQISILCNEVLVLEEGRMVMLGEPDTAIKCYNDLMRQRTEKRAAQVFGETVRPSFAVEYGYRTGTQEATVSAVYIYRTKGKTTDAVYNGENLTIELEYNITVSLTDMALTLGIYNETNVKCFETCITSMNAYFGPLSRCGSISCYLPELPLLPGLYYVNVGLYPISWDYVYDYHWEMHALHVLSKGTAVSGVSGVVNLNPVWSFSKRD